MINNPEIYLTSYTSTGNMSIKSIFMLERYLNTRYNLLIVCYYFPNWIQVAKEGIVYQNEYYIEKNYENEIVRTYCQIELRWKYCIRVRVSLVVYLCAVQTRYFEWYGSSYVLFELLASLEAFCHSIFLMTWKFTRSEVFYELQNNFFKESGFNSPTSFLKN